MKPPVILIIKTGSTYAELKSEQSDFDAMIRKGGGECNCTWKVKPVANVEPERIPNYQGIIISGAHTSLTQHYPYFRGMERVVEQIIEHRIHTLAICFGHQLVHQILGGSVIVNPLGTELGVVEIMLTIQGLTDPLFKGQGGSRIKVYASHSDIVIKPAPDFVQLAWNEISEFQATRYEGFLYTTQFHPEYTKNIMALYLTKNLELLAKQHVRNPLYFPATETVLKNNKARLKTDLMIQNFINLIAEGHS